MQLVHDLLEILSECNIRIVSHYIYPNNVCCFGLYLKLPESGCCEYEIAAALASWLTVKNRFKIPNL